MAVNKVIYNNQTLIDLTADTATAADVSSGKTFHLADGTIATGSASGGGTGGAYQDENGFIVLNDDSGGVAITPLSVTSNNIYTAPAWTAYSPVTVNVSGGGGFESESGTYEPSVDIVDPTISFARAHAKPPAVIVMADVTTGSVPPSYSTVMFSYIDVLQLCGEGFPSTATSVRYYGKYNTTYKGNSSMANRNGNMQYPYTDTEHTSTASACRYWATESNFCPRPNSSDYWRAGHTYKWIAIWKT